MTGLCQKFFSQLKIVGVLNDVLCTAKLSLGNRAPGLTGISVKSDIYDIPIGNGMGQGFSDLGIVQGRTFGIKKCHIILIAGSVHHLGCFGIFNRSIAVQGDSANQHCLASLQHLQLGQRLFGKLHQDIF